MQARFVNTTPHPVKIATINNEIIEIPPDPAAQFRITEEYHEESCVNNVRIVRIRRIAPEPPPIMNNTYYIVSNVVKSAYPDRDDFVVPTDFVRDENGYIVYARAFAR